MAAEDLEQLVLSISADTAQIRRAIKRLEGDTGASTKKIERQFTQLGSRIDGTFLRIGRSARNVLGALGVGFGLKEAQGLIDTATRIENALKVAGLSGDKLAAVYGRLRDSALANAAPLESLVDLYGRAALVQNELGISSEELLNFTDKIALALRVNGKSAEASSGALLQLSQALGSGIVRAEEFNSLLEGALPVAQAAAAGLEEAGGSVAKLRQLVVDGKVSSEAFFRAFEAGAVTLEEKVAGSTFTVANATENLYTAFVDLAGEFNKSTGAGDNMAGAINRLAQAMADLDVDHYVSEIRDAYNATVQFLNAAGNADVFKRFNEAMGIVTADGRLAIDVETTDSEQKLAQLIAQVEKVKQIIDERASMNLDTSEAESTLATLAARILGIQTAISQTARQAATITPGVSDEKVREIINGAVPFNPLPPVSTPKKVSLKNYPLSGTGKGGGGGGGSKENEYQREVEQIKQRTAALQAETAAQAGLNPLIEDFGYAAEKARATQDLLNAAKQAGLEVTPKLTAEIERLASKYAGAEAAAQGLKQAQDDARDAIEAQKDAYKELGDTALDAGQSLADALDDGKLSGQELLQILFDVGKQLLSMKDIGSLFGNIFSALTGGGINYFQPGLYASGGRISGAGTGKSDSIPIMASNGEYMVNAAATRKFLPLLEAINGGTFRGFADGGQISGAALAAIPRAPAVRSRETMAINAPVSLTIDARGATDPAAIERAGRQILEQVRREHTANTLKSLKDIKLKGLA